jgi:ribose transport system substrate-binding protein
MSIWHGCSKPYEYGYQSVRVLTEMLIGNKSVIPESKYIDVPARAVTKDGRKVGDQKSEQVDEFWADLKEKVGN